MSGLGRGNRLLRVGSWAFLPAGAAVVVTVDTVDPSAGPSTLVAGFGVFFALLLARLVLSIVQQPTRRPALLMVLGCVLLWATGSAMIDGPGKTDLTHFPAPGEWFFLAAYVAEAGYLVADSAKRRTTSASTWLEATIVCGGTACLAGGVLVDPISRQVVNNGAGLLLTLLYPLIDIVLTLLVVGQIVLGFRGGWRNSAPLVAALALITAADALFVATLSDDNYGFGLLNIVIWGLGYALLVDYACRPRTAARTTNQPSRGLVALVLAGAMAATAALAFEPPGPIRDYLLGPAIVTLAAAGARMLLALRAANRAAEAVALSLSDDLTGLPNRRAIYGELDSRLRTGRPVALMIMDLNGFKDINDTLGHSAGDAVLCHIARQVSESIPPDVIFARLGGDEFAVLAGTVDEWQLYEIGQQIRSAARTPFEVDGIALSVDASIGITARDGDEAATELLRRADIAMYDAKSGGKGIVLYDPQSDEFSRERLALGEDLRRAIADGELELWYQPQFDALTRQVCSLEALVRWQHPVRGLLNPVEFLPVARRAGLMQSMSEEIGRIAVADLVKWRSQGLHPHLAINCAPPELMSGLFLPRLGEQLRAAGFDASRVTIELTEDSFLAEPERARSLLLDLRDLGFEVSVDDFGTGFSSLSYLRDLPISELKMDRSFIAAMTADPRSRMIVVSTYQLADALGLRMVAEGVEDAATADDLVRLGIHVLQGYHLCRPLAPAAMTEFLRRAGKPRLAPGVRAG